MIKIGLTGGIGSGKTTVSKLFKERGIPVFNSDMCARDAENELHIQEGFKAILGNDIFVDGKLDRVKMRGVVFTDKDKLAQVNKLVAPYVKQKFEKFCTDLVDSPIVMLESAILFEMKSNSYFDYIITVTATENTRIRRVIARDNCELKDVMDKLANQIPEMDKILDSDFIIINDGYDMTESLVLMSKQIDAVKKAISFDALIKGLNEPIQ